MQKSFHQEERIILADKKLNGQLETLHLAPTQFCDLPGFYRKTVFLRSHPLSLVFIPEGQNKN